MKLAAYNLRGYSFGGRRQKFRENVVLTHEGLIYVDCAWDMEPGFILPGEYMVVLVRTTE